jgi:hypothetical protein
VGLGCGLAVHARGQACRKTHSSLKSCHVR